jgi:hypothetical protein
MRASLPLCLVALGITAVAGAGCKPSSGSGGQGAGPTGGASVSQGASVTIHPGNLVDDGLVARYYLDEAASGQQPSEALDAASDPVHLTIRYSNANEGGAGGGGSGPGTGGMAPAATYIEDGEGHRGLHFPAAEMTDVAYTKIAGTKFTADLNTKKTATYEVVADIVAVSSSLSRLSHIGTGTGHTLSLETDSPSLIQFTLNDDHGHYASTQLGQLGRAVYHAVLDIEATDPKHRVKFYVNGSRILTLSPNENLDMNTTIELDPAAYYCIGNRYEIDEDDGRGRSIQGTIYYSAIYKTPFTADQVLHNTAVLLVSDDTPLE